MLKRHMNMKNDGCNDCNDKVIFPLIQKHHIFKPNNQEKKEIISKTSTFDAYIV